MRFPIPPKTVFATTVKIPAAISTKNPQQATGAKPDRTRTAEYSSALANDLDPSVTLAAST